MWVGSRSVYKEITFCVSLQYGIQEQIPREKVHRNGCFFRLKTRSEAGTRACLCSQRGENPKPPQAGSLRTHPEADIQGAGAAQDKGSRGGTGEGTGVCLCCGFRLREEDARWQLAGGRGGHEKPRHENCRLPHQKETDALASRHRHSRNLQGGGGSVIALRSHNYL